MKVLTPEGYYIVTDYMPDMDTSREFCAAIILAIRRDPNRAPSIEPHQDRKNIRVIDKSEPSRDREGRIFAWS